MAWNEPGGEKRNPWNRPSQGGKELDEIMRNLQRKLASWFGGGSAGGGPKTSGFGFGLSSVFLLLGALWVGWGIYNVDAQERGVVLRFGKYVGTTDPGIHWHLPWPMEKVTLVNVSRVYSVADDANMLTADTNLVEVKSAVQYIQPDPIKVLFSVRDMEVTLNQVSESAMREAIGQASLDKALAFDPSITDRAKTLLQRTLDSYNTGIRIVSVNLVDVNVPEPVQQAQQDAIKADKDKQRFQQEAELYRNDIVPKARGAASIEVQSAEAYRQQVVALAQGETARFNSVLGQYQRAPAVTRERMYIETVESVLGNSRKIILATKAGSNNMLYLPLDKIMPAGATRAVIPEITAGPIRNVDGSAAEESRAGGAR
jgi:modulator of FtsH protease HflK